ncbi:MAG: hypothetical protein BGO31_16910 [Bacteroidetes bacterium 43-16]|uniref:hypothetical protein n=1 Tax=uncultured Flavobacterium sp. TaxID=165435 RepID=UPI0009268DFB|nr:hypothetical protein [uncultured Flavobacterium sp.]OJV55775.1 MAG: hypothetical protein BGO31_16910 [Bacteroidetes bacterium 43-16]
MKKNMYYKTLYQRKNLIKEFLLNLFIELSSHPRMVLEVFIRKKMGRRYFRTSTAITVAVALFIIPFFWSNLRQDFIQIISDNWLWYLFIPVFLFFSFLRYKDIKHIKSQFDFNHFSLSTGEIHPLFHKIKINGKPFSVRTIEIFLEPLLFFLIGLFLIFIDQNSLGWLLVICSAIYSLSYSGTYMHGDNFILDRIDNIISGEEIYRTFVSDDEPSRGFRFYGDKPTSKEMREEVLENIIVDDEEITDAV